MKKIKIILYTISGIFIIVLALGVYKFNFTNDDIFIQDSIKTDTINKIEKVNTGNIVPTKIIEKIADGKYCFNRIQVATKTAPYSVNEKIKIEIKGDKVTGTKTGNQSGPDLTNGYFGDLNGSIKDNILELVYSYTVEGANGKELENYEFQDGYLVKMRWPLVSKNKMLVPDKTGEPQKQIYNKVLCEKKIAEPSEPNTPTVCTMDAKLCPDGSYVGRTGTKCEFVCP